MDDFLMSSSAAAKTSFRGNQRVHVILGSESCDLDSVVSSLAMAYFLYRTSSGLPGGSSILPVLNIPRSQFHLRAEVLLLLRESGITTETLVFRDEVDLGCLHGDRRLVLTLVDHNVLPSTDSVLGGAVVEVIDHHQLERTTSFSCPVTVEMVASCATLVTERILSRGPKILDRHLALLLYEVGAWSSAPPPSPTPTHTGAMVVDSAGKGTVKDSQMVQLLQTQFPDLPHRVTLHTTLHKAKFNLSGLSTEQILLKDMKVVSVDDVRVAVSNIYMSLELLLNRTNLQQGLCDVCHSHSLDAVVAMMISFNDQLEEPVRQLVVYSPSSEYRQEVSHTLIKIQSPALCLSPVSSPYKDILAYYQGNALASRSKLLPVFTRFLSDWRQRDFEDQLDQSDMMISDTFPVSKESSTDDHLPYIYSVSHHHRRRLQLGAEDYGNMEEDSCSRMPPPAPKNSLVDGCPLDGGFSQEALLEKFSRMGGMEEEPGGRGQ